MMNADKSIRPVPGTYIHPGLQFVSGRSKLPVYIYICGTGHRHQSPCRCQVILQVVGNQQRRSFFLVALRSDSAGIRTAMARVDGNAFSFQSAGGSKVDPVTHRGRRSLRGANHRTAHRSSPIFHGGVFNFISRNIHHDTGRPSCGSVLFQDKALQVEPFYLFCHRHAHRNAVLIPVYTKAFCQIAFNCAAADHLGTQPAGDFDLQFFIIGNGNIVTRILGKVHYHPEHVKFIHAPVYISNQRCRRSSTGHP